MSKREILILNSPELTTIGVLLAVFDEVCGAFKRQGYVVKVINKLSDLHNNSIVFIGNQFHVNNPAELLNKYAPDAIYIGWYWQNIDVSSMKYFIHTYENMLNISYSKSRMADFIKLRSSMYNCPLLLRANEDSNLIGTYTKNVRFDCCYIGSPYCTELKPSSSFKTFYHLVFSPNDYISYEKRKIIYLASMFALGFQSTENIYSEHVSQRIYEGLAYGCIVFSNSKPACDQTEGIVIYISSREDLENKMIYYKNNPELLKKKQDKGYEFIKKYGTNEQSIKLFTDIIQDKMSLNI